METYKSFKVPELLYGPDSLMLLRSDAAAALGVRDIQILCEVIGLVCTSW